jgi:acyl dehydratase
MNRADIANGNPQKGSPSSTVATTTGGARYWQDFAVGEVFESPRRTVTETDIVNFVGLSWDMNPLHTDEESARSSPFGRRIAHGALGIAIVTGLLARLGHLNGTALAMLGIDDWRFRLPVFAGDTLHVRVTIESLRASSTPERGIVDRRIELVNQDGAVVQSGRIPVLVRGRGVE